MTVILKMTVILCAKDYMKLWQKGVRKDIFLNRETQDEV